MENTLIIPNEFTSYEHFCGVVVNQLFEEKNITGVIEEIDGESDAPRRIFVMMEDGREYIIRNWNIHDDDDNVYIEYTLFTEDTDFDTTIEL
jgi:hypothetical protein